MFVGIPNNRMFTTSAQPRILEFEFVTFLNLNNILKVKNVYSICFLPLVALKNMLGFILFQAVLDHLSGLSALTLHLLVSLEPVSYGVIRQFKVS